ncbi:DUF6993 domain-containing protein [Arthrobacter sp. Leaf69]|uniref:DUF6993 domain-containing protein n=1 Tax=Arthrobacter sp. Leaf69 TaxID=1736232 RepID=UPI000AC7C6C9|nr:hypothetical protein [Arthrobacter sp. Leaf69]
MKQAGTFSHTATLAPGGSGLPALVLALGLVLTSAVACSAPSEAVAAGTTSSSVDGTVEGGAGGSGARPSSGAALDAALGATPGAVPGATEDAATSDTKARVEAALNRVTAADRRLDTEQVRSALIDAGFPSGSVEVTASRTPTGLDADAVEVAVSAGQDCIVGQLRDGSVTSAVLPPLADGRCLVGAAG